MNALESDVRSAVRALWKARGFTLVAVTTLAIGMTLCVTVMAVVNAYAVRAMPYPDADRLYRVDYGAPGQNPPRGLETLDWNSLADIVEHPLAWDLDVFYMLGGEFPESTPGAWVTPGYMAGYGVRVARGRTFEAADYAAGSPAVAIISHRTWQSRFGGDAAIIGRQFQAYVSDRPDEPESFAIVGVLPPDHWHLNAYSEVLAPLKAASYPYMVRLRPGASAEIAAERITALVRNGIPSLPSDWRAIVTSLQASYVATIRPMLWSVGAAAALVLLIAAANVAVLLLVRGRHRQKELALRLALGASPGRVARLLAVEGIVLGGLAAVGALIGTQLAIESLGPVIEQLLERRVPGGIGTFALDADVLVIAAICAVAITVLCAMVPVIASWRQTVALNLASSSRGATEGVGPRRTRAILIGLEVAASLTLLAGAALMAETAIRMLRVDFGIRPDNVVTASLSLRQRSYPTPTGRAEFFDRVTTQVAQVRGVSHVALGDWWPLQTPRPTRIETGGPNPVAGEANVFSVSPRYFDTVGMTLRAGRDFTVQDRAGSEPVAVVSEALALRMWPNGRALGQTLAIHRDDAATPAIYRVVGVTNDVRQMHSDSQFQDLYLPLAQQAGRFAFLFARGTPSATWDRELRAAVAAIDPEVALGATRPLATGLEQERTRPRVLALLLTVFAAFACLLALVGMHGVIAYAVKQRQREIAVRIAIGATARSVTRLFLRQGSVVLAIGIGAGLAGALGLGRILQSQLHDVRPHEPRLLAGAAIALAACGLFAMWWPARRASTTDPLVILKED
jgi:predicted permease